MRLTAISLILAATGAVMSGIGLGALPASAGTSFSPPKGCELDLTAQLRGCRVENLYHCASDPAGDRRMDFADDTGSYYLSHIDKETRWISSVDLASGVSDALDAKASKDNASFTALLKTGQDDYDFVTRSNDGEVRRYIGYDRLTGEKVTIGPMTLERSAFRMRVEDGFGHLVAHREGTELVSRTLRVFFAETETVRPADGDPVDDVSTPLLIARPGDKGFGAAAPLFDCEMTMTAISPTLHHPTL